ncbi:MAG: hypothetical protein ACRDWI_00545 [Jiangellaceae bacterium]
MGAAQPAGEGGAAWLRRYWPLVAWAVLFVPPLIYFGVGTIPSAAGVQDTLAAGWLFPVVAALMVVGVIWLTWQLIVVTRSLPGAARTADGDLVGRIGFRIAIAAGACAAGSLGVISWLSGMAADERVVNSFHVLDALSDLLLVGGFALMLAAVVFFPPFGLVAVAGGATVLVPTITTGFVVTSALGVSGILLSQAVGSQPPSRPSRPSRSGSSGSDPVPDMPQLPAPPKPAVRHWKLRRIVDDLWRGTGRSDRIGNGTTMDAVRNEIRTGRATHGKMHVEKAQKSVRALQNWLRNHRDQASRADRLHAHRLIAELERALKGS